MGYPTISEFDKIFIQRTKENLDCQVKNEYTQLMNSLLGLIVLPRQWTVQGKRNPEFFKKKVLDVFPFLNGSDNISDETSSNVEIKKLIFHPQPINDMTISTLMEKLRHSIAHQSIRPTLSDRNKWAGIIFRNYDGSEKQVGEWKDNYIMQVYFTMEELKLVATTITDEYLNDNKN